MDSSSAPPSVHDLLSDDGRALLAELPPYDEKDAVRLTTRLRAEGHDPQLVAAALTQSRLRARARTKFGNDAAVMFFTPDALEQATRAPVAALHAERLHEAGSEAVIDGGCGIGADAVGFARAGLCVIGVEADATTAALARANLAPWPDTDVENARLEDAADRLREENPTAAWWFDPARRLPGVADITGRTKRTFSLEALSPSWSLVQELAGHAPAAGAKLSPGLAHHDIPAATEAEFVSYDGDVVEACVWWGAAVRDAGRSATILRPRHRGATDVAELLDLERLHVTTADAAGADDAPVTRETLGDHLYEADKALTRSGLVGALLKAVDGQEFVSGFGYVSSDSIVDVGLLGRAYRVLDVIPLHVKTLRSHLRAHDVGRLTIKKRDVDLDADALRRSLKLKGSVSMTVALTTFDGERVALVVEPVVGAR